MTMKTVTLKIPESLDAKIRRALKRSNESFSDLARRALTREVEERRSFADAAGHCCGMFVGPGDLSTREGYGPRRNHR